MICRRGGIAKGDIGAIKIYRDHTEFEISAQAAEQFSANLKRPDKEENIRIEAQSAGPQGEASEKGADRIAGNRKVYEGRARQNDKPPRFEQRQKPHGKAAGETSSKFDSKPSLDNKKGQKHRPTHAGQASRDQTPFAKPVFGKKPEKNRYRP